jgi:hypothetical protein
MRPPFSLNFGWFLYTYDTHMREEDGRLRKGCEPCRLLLGSF